MSDPGRTPADTSAVAGRSRWPAAHVLALVLAALADVGAFSQVVALVLRDQPMLVIYTVVIGLTATAVYLAHTCGALLRDRAIGRSGDRVGLLLVTGLAWLALGLAAFAVRLRLDSTAGYDSGLIVDGAYQPDSSAGANAWLPATVFLALYVGTGLTAAAGAYLNGNPLRGRYASARRRRAIAADRASLSAATHGEVEAVKVAQQAAYDDSAELLEIEKRVVLAFAAELKQYARIRMAELCKDPEVTRALFEPDARPYRPRQFGAPDE